MHGSSRWCSYSLNVYSAYWSLIMTCAFSPKDAGKHFYVSMYCKDTCACCLSEVWFISSMTVFQWVRHLSWPHVYRTLRLFFASSSLFFFPWCTIACFLVACDAFAFCLCCGPISILVGVFSPILHKFFHGILWAICASWCPLVFPCDIWRFRFWVWKETIFLGSAYCRNCVTNLCFFGDVLFWTDDKLMTIICWRVFVFFMYSYFTYSEPDSNFVCCQLACFDGCCAHVCTFVCVWVYVCEWVSIYIYIYIYIYILFSQLYQSISILGMC